MLYKDVVKNSDDDKVADDLKNDQLFDSDILNMMTQLIANLSQIFEKYDNQKFARFLLSCCEQIKILEHIDDKMNVISEHFVKMQNKALKMTQNIIEQQEIMKLTETEIQVKMSSILINVLTQTEAEKILRIDFR